MVRASAPPRTQSDHMRVQVVWKVIVRSRSGRQRARASFGAGRERSREARRRRQLVQRPRGSNGPRGFREPEETQAAVPEGGRERRGWLPLSPRGTAQGKALSFDKAGADFQGVKCFLHSPALPPLNGPRKKGLSPCRGLGDRLRRVGFGRPRPMASVPSAPDSGAGTRVDRSVEAKQGDFRSGSRLGRRFLPLIHASPRTGARPGPCRAAAAVKGARPGQPTPPPR